MAGGKQFDYSSDPRWRRLRERTLSRDRCRCRECSRYGRVSDAEIVHHAWPVEDWPELAFCAWNLVSLCGSCHDKMHERRTRQLTAVGERWRRLTKPPGV